MNRGAGAGMLDRPKLQKWPTLPCFVTALHGSEVSIFSLLLASDGASTQHMAQTLGFNMTSVLIVLQAVKSLLH